MERELDLSNATNTSTSCITPTHNITSIDVTTLEHYGSTILEELNMVEKENTIGGLVLKGNKFGSLELGNRSHRKGKLALDKWLTHIE